MRRSRTRLLRPAGGVAAGQGDQGDQDAQGKLMQKVFLGFNYRYLLGGRAATGRTILVYRERGNEARAERRRGGEGRGERREKGGAGSVFVELSLNGG